MRLVLVEFGLANGMFEHIAVVGFALRASLRLLARSKAAELATQHLLSTAALGMAGVLLADEFGLLSVLDDFRMQVMLLSVMFAAPLLPRAEGDISARADLAFRWLSPRLTAEDVPERPRAAAADAAALELDACDDTIDRGLVEPPACTVALGQRAAFQAVLSA